MNALRIVQLSQIILKILIFFHNSDHNLFEAESEEDD